MIEFVVLSILIEAAFFIALLLFIHHDRYVKITKKNYEKYIGYVVRIEDDYYLGKTGVLTKKISFIDQDTGKNIDAFVINVNKKNVVCFDVYILINKRARKWKLKEN